MISSRFASAFIFHLNITLPKNKGNDAKDGVTYTLAIINMANSVIIPSKNISALKFGMSVP